MPTFRITLEYDGTDFSGWQRQLVPRTVQGEVEAALALLCRRPVPIKAAGRTDAGVHATGQVASFGLEALPWGDRIDRALPEDIAVRDLSVAPPGFSARHDALQRSYRYRIRRRRRPLSRHLSWIVPYGLDPEPMAEAIDIIREHKDFKAFTRVELELPAYMVELSRLELVPAEDGFDLLVRARRFLHNMIRIMAGTLVDVGRGRLSPADVDHALLMRDRRLAGPTAPPHGLCFEGADYPEVDSRPAERQKRPAPPHKEEEGLP